MNRFKVALKACEMACIDLKLLHLYMDICPKVRESQGKFALKSQGKSGILVRAYSWEPWLKPLPRHALFVSILAWNTFKYLYNLVHELGYWVWTKLKTCKFRHLKWWFWDQVPMGHKNDLIFFRLSIDTSGVPYATFKATKNLFIFVAHRHPGPLTPNHLAKFKRPRVWRSLRLECFYTLARQRFPSLRSPCTNLD